MNYRGVIIEESLENRDVLKMVRILETKVEEITERHRTPWLKQWTLDTVEIPEANAEKIAEVISHSLEAEHPWYADFKNATMHYIIFRNKVFRANRNSEEEYRAAKEYGISLGIPEHQVDFSPDVVVE